MRFVFNYLTSAKVKQLLTQFCKRDLFSLLVVTKPQLMQTKYVIMKDVLGLVTFFVLKYRMLVNAK